MKRKVKISYKHNLVEKARQLRNNATFSERLLWKHLKGKQIEGYDFDRQKDLERYGLKVLRFNALDVVQNIQGVLEKIYYWINENTKPTPNPSQEGKLTEDL